MARFKSKGKVLKKENSSANMFSLAEKHSNTLNEFSNQENILPKKQKLLASLKNKLRTIELSKRNAIELEIKELSEEIKMIDTKTNLYDYVLENSQHLYKYYHDNDSTDKAAMFENYMKGACGLRSLKVKIKGTGYCINCGLEKVLLPCESSMSCPSCGEAEEVMISCDKPSYQDVPNDTGRAQFTYDRMHHFRELLNQAQGKESTNISSDIFNAIKREIKKQRLEPHELNKSIIKKILQKLDLTSKYEHVSQILYKLNPNSTLTFSQETEDKLCYMFMCIQEPYIEICKLYSDDSRDSRSNFYNYNYIFHKFCEILDLNEVINGNEHFKLLKNPDKLRNYEKFWKKVIKWIQNNPERQNDGINWRFIATV